MTKETKTYLVGGAVRDELLGLEPQDLDYVVVNGNADDFLKRGFTKVGKDFPVFLDPETKNQFAFARKERKVAPGYNGFEFETDGVTLEEDLYRRDLTINAMAKDEKNNLVDLFGGYNDLKNKLLKHVSKHFAEDPLRVLRVARFQARYNNFTVHPETMELMKDLCRREAKDLDKNRVRAETLKALTETEPFLYFKTLKEAGLFSALGYDLQLPESLKLSRDVELAVAQLSLYQKDTNKFFDFMLYLLCLGKNNKKLMTKYVDLWQLSSTTSKENLLKALVQSKATNTNVFVEKMKELSCLQQERLDFWETLEMKAAEAKKIDTSFVESLPAKDRTKAVLEAYAKLF